MEQRQLNYQADQIEQVLAAHRAPARVLGGRLTPRTIQFHLAPEAHTRITRLAGLTEELALALGAPTARLTRFAGTLALEVPRTAPAPLALGPLARRLSADPGLHRALAQPGTAILGVDSQGIPLLLRLTSPEVAHCLLAGTTGCGKTALARTLVASLLMHQAPHDLALALLDPKGSAFAPFARAPHLLFPIAHSPHELIGCLRTLVVEMERRDREAISRPRLVVVIDELADALQQGGQPLLSLLTRLVQRGRSAGLSIIACTQKPTAAAIGSLLKANFPVRLVGRVTSAEEARIAAGVSGSGAERLAGRGDFVLRAGGETIHFQAAYITNEEIEQVCAAAAPAQTVGGWLPRLGRRRASP